MNIFMELALKQAKLAADNHEIPVGAVIADVNGNIVAKSFNQVEKLQDATAHAELNVIKEAIKLKKNKFLADCYIYVTLEPCAMCAAAISLVRMRRLYFGAYDPKSGGTYSGAQIFNSLNCHHRPEIYDGINEKQASELLKRFFKNLR